MDARHCLSKHCSLVACLFLLLCMNIFTASALVIDLRDTVTRQTIIAVTCYIILVLLESACWNYEHTHTRLMALCLGLPGWASTRRVKPVWILLKQETVSGNGINWAVCKSASRCRQITMPAPHQSVFTGRMPFLTPSQQHQSTEGRLKLWSEMELSSCVLFFYIVCALMYDMPTGGFSSYKCHEYLVVCIPIHCRVHSWQWGWENSRKGNKCKAVESSSWR